MCGFLCSKCSKTHLRASLIPKIFLEVIPLTPVKGGVEGKGREGREEEWLRHGCWGMDAPAWTPLGELTMLPRYPSWLGRGISPSHSSSAPWLRFPF